MEQIIHLAFWASYRTGFRTALRRYGAVTVAPTPLTDCESPTYALMAPLSGYPLTAAVVYLASYLVLARFPIDTLTTELAGKPIDTTASGLHLGMLVQTQQHPRRASPRPTRRSIQP